MCNHRICWLDALGIVILLLQTITGKNWKAQPTIKTSLCLTLELIMNTHIQNTWIALSAMIIIWWYWICLKSRHISASLWDPSIIFISGKKGIVGSRSESNSLWYVWWSCQRYSAWNITPAVQTKYYVWILYCFSNNSWHCQSARKGFTSIGWSPNLFQHNIVIFKSSLHRCVQYIKRKTLWAHNNS